MEVKTESELLEIITISGLSEHHTCLKNGYVSRKLAGIVEDYSGRYGKGIVVLRPNFHSTRYCYITYYLEEN